MKSEQKPSFILTLLTLNRNQTHTLLSKNIILCKDLLRNRGVLRKIGEINCLSSVTGAKTDSSGGLMVGF